MATNKDLKFLFHDSKYPAGLGCGTCPEKKTCGGEYTLNLFDCMQKCCNNPKECDYVCKKDIESFLEYFHSVNGFDFDDVPRFNLLPFPSLPYAVPLIKNFSNRLFPLEIEAVALQLWQLFDHRTGIIKFANKKHLAEHFGFSPNAKVIISGVSKDVPLEDYWFLGRVTNLAQQISFLEPDLITSPNFSVFLDSPRYDNLFNMKRILICWSELHSYGLPTSLHLNARTDYDWERWIDLIGERPEINSISFEFATGASFAKRGKWHTENLLKLASTVNRDIQLTIRGGYKYLSELYKGFPDLVFIDSTSFMKSINRYALTWQDENHFQWISVASPDMEYIDELMIQNIEENSSLISRKITSSYYE